MNSNKKVYGISAGNQQYGSGDIFEATAYKESTQDEGEMAKNKHGEWIDVLGMLFVGDDGEPHMVGWRKYIPTVVMITHDTEAYWKDHNTVITQDLAGYNDEPCEISWSELSTAYQSADWKSAMAELLAVRPE